MTSTNQPRLTVRSTADLITAVPYLLGFHPSESVVMVAMRDTRIIFVARGDLPPGAHGDAPGVARFLADVVGAQDAQTATIIGYGPAERVTPVIDEIRAAFDPAAAGRALPRLLDALRVTDGRYWSYFCDNPRCCPIDGTPFDPTTSQFAAEATVAGQVALPDRAALVRQVEPVTGPARDSMRRATALAEERLADLLDDAPPADLLGGRTLRRAGAAAVTAALARHREGGVLTDDEVGWLTLLLTHLPVRDDAWERTDGTEWHLTLWTDVLRRAEPDLVPAPACLLSFTAWRAGQGALAAVALERALVAQPDYSMAHLLGDLLARGVPPSRLDGWPRVGGRLRRPTARRKPNRRHKRGRHCAN